MVLRGARQVGKTTLVRKFAGTYKQKILLNLEKPRDKFLFESYEEVTQIRDALFLSRKLSLAEEQDTLLFIDEIQESPRAIHLLRYFYEEIPNLHIIAAGSLLEFAMRHVKGFPVGRIEYCYIHPLNFQEFLLAMGYDMALEQLRQVPLQPQFHLTLLDLFHQYAIVGGMPEVVAKYVTTSSAGELTKLYAGIWTTYRNDVEKYARNEAERKVIKHIMNSAHLNLDERVKFQNFGNSSYRSREVGEAFRNLDDARIIRLVYPTTDIDPPLRPDLKKSPRLQFLDTGLVNYALEIQAQLLGMKDFSDAYKGALIPHLITQELMSLDELSDKTPNFWVRDKSQSQAELDLLFVSKGNIVPIEIKSGASGSLRSLHQFIERSGLSKAIRIYGGPYKIERHTTATGQEYTLMNLPYYLGTMIPEYAEALIKMD